MSRFHSHVAGGEMVTMGLDRGKGDSEVENAFSHRQCCPTRSFPSASPQGHQWAACGCAGAKIVLFGILGSDREKINVI